MSCAIGSLKINRQDFGRRFHAFILGISICAVAAGFFIASAQRSTAATQFSPTQSGPGSSTPSPSTSAQNAAAQNAAETPSPVSYGEVESNLEAEYQKIPSAQRAEANLRRITSAPHMAGTEGSHKVAEWLAEQYRGYGFDAQLVSYSVWMPQPSEIKLELLEPTHVTLGTQEAPIPQDKDSQNRHLFPAFNSYAASGDVKAPVIYVNYGTPEDYKQLDAMNIDVAGKIVLARYGKSYRGIKAKLAEEHHAIGLLIYSDPYDDGYDAGDPDPAGPWRPLTGIQRGSVLYTEIYPGDPLTPGVAATADAARISPAEAASLPRIPTLPINAQDAEQILRNLGAGKIPREWQGGLPFTYHSGPGAIVHLKLAMDYRQRNIYDVIAKLPGVDAGTDHDDWVVLGNHHDAWVYGAVDPNSGTAVMLETARSLGELARKGWKPLHSIVMCEWDGEEEGLLGSTEWVEQNVKELQSKALVYINVDVGVAGPNFSAGGTPSLKEMLISAANAVNYPGQPQTVYQAWRERAKKAREEKPNPALDEIMVNDVPVGDLGAGSDYCPFFDFAGVPSVEMGFGGDYGVYHSMYDDFYWMKHFGDPTFEFHAALAKILGVLTLRFANFGGSYEYAAYADRIERQVKSLMDRVDHDQISGLDLKPLLAAAEKFRAATWNIQSDHPAGNSGAAARASGADAAHAHTNSALDNRTNPQLNHAWAAEEQAFLSQRGLIGRPWYKHTIFAPGSYAGYASVVLPGLTEAIWRKDVPTAQQEASEIEAAISRASSHLAQLSSSTK